MEQQHQITFGPFRLETPQGGLWRGDQRCPLRPRSLALLGYLVGHAGHVVPKAELHAHVWRDTHVTDSVLRTSVHEIRVALGDAAGAPQYLETVGRQGYRWLGGHAGEAPPPQTAGPLVGRQGELVALEGWYQQAAHGSRQLVFVSGEAGVGKTTVVEMFLRQLATGGARWTARGQCVEHSGAGEPYLPFLEALGRLGQGAERDVVLAVLRRYAPLWLAQLPGLVSEPELERLHGRLHGTTPARMLRELAEALEVLTAERVLVLLLEDLQWSDPSTVEALAYLAQRREPARLLVLGTYRPVEVMLQAHPLRGMVQELYGRGQGSELRLEFLTTEDVAAYVAGRLGGAVAAPLTALVAARTDGNALFMVTIVEHLVQQGVVVRRVGQWTLREAAEAHGLSLPAGLRALLLWRIDALPPETRRVLEVASVVGEASRADVEAVCAALAVQRHVLDDTGWTVWPDGTRGGTYRFRHALYRQALYERLGTMQRVQLHGRIGARLAAGYGAQAGEIATQLALHFEHGGEVPRAVHYWQQAGDNATRRYAYHEAVAALTKGVALLATVPDSRARAHDELRLLLILGPLLMGLKGQGDPHVGEVYTRAHTLCHQVGEPSQRAQVLRGLYRFHNTQAQWSTADTLSQQLLHLAQHQHDPVVVLEGHMAVGSVALFRGDLATARGHLEQSMGLCAPDMPLLSSSGGFADRVIILALLTQALWASGYAAQAQQRSQEAVALAQQVGHPPSLAWAATFAARLAQYRRDAAATQAHADTVMTLAVTHGLAHRVEHGRLLRGWALALQGHVAAGLAHLQQGVAALQETGPKSYHPYWLALLAEAYGQAGQPEAGLTALDEAVTLAATTEERWWEAELWRLKGELLLQLPLPEVGEAEACWQRALDVARRQQAKSFELRAAMSLSRLWQQQGKQAEARELLAPIYSWFTEGFDTADLQEAKALLEALGA